MNDAATPAMNRVLELLIAAALVALMLSPVVALLAGTVVLLTGLAFVPVFAPLTTLLAIGCLAWLAVKDARRRRRGTPE